MSTTAMAHSVTPRKRAKIDATTAKEPRSSDVGPPRCQPPSTDAEDCRKPVTKAATVDGGSAPTLTGQLRAELESARRSIEQLRREKADEARRARQESDTALRQLAERLREERQRVVEQVRERCAAESSRATAQKDREVQRLRDELDLCRAEQRADLERRGGATGPALYAGERVRLLQKVTDAEAGKRRAEQALRSAVDADRQKTAEIRRLHEDCRAEVSRVSKEANLEIRRLLDELKTKDHQLALLDRNQYPDRGAGIAASKQPGESPPAAREQDTSTGPVRGTPPSAAAKSDRTLKQGDLQQAEMVSALKADVERLTSELKASEVERTSMKERLDELNTQLESERCRQPIVVPVKPALAVGQQEKIQRTDTEPYSGKHNHVHGKTQPKAVRFLLPGETEPVLAREMPSMVDDDCDASVSSDISDTASVSSVSSSTSSLRLSPDATSIFDGNLENSYHLLLTEHLSLQRNVAKLLSKWTQTPSRHQNITCGQACVAEKESMKAAIGTLKAKVHTYQETEYKLHRQLKDQQEQNEDLEFRLLELEHCAEQDKSICVVDELLERNQSLEIEISLLRQKLSEIDDVKMQQKSETKSLFHSSVQSPVPMVTVEDKAPECLIGGDADTMTCSISTTTSGFDDNSCASSVAGDYDEMPSEETWNFEIGVCHHPNLEPGQPCSAALEFNQQNTSGDEEHVEIEVVESAEYQSSSMQNMIPEEQVRRMEKIWISRMEKLERRLLQAVEGEQRARDQLVLLAEEKDRRIAALVNQVDRLEANDFHLTKTIQTLEKLERAFSSHFLVSLDALEHSRRTDTTTNPVLRANGESSGVEEEKTGQESQEAMSLAQKNKDTEDEDFIPGHPCNDKSCFQCHACETLKGTIARLYAALEEQSEVDRRVRELEEGKDTQTMLWNSRAENELVEFDAEYRELEALFKELKQVLVVDKSPDSVYLNRSSDKGKKDENKNFDEESSLSVDIGVHWNAEDDDDETISMHISPRCDELDSPALVALSERNRELEITEQYLHQQISDLEMERDQLREVVHREEATISDLGVAVAELQATEKSLTDEASRLRTKNDWMSGRIDGLLELVGRLEEADRAQRVAAGELRLRAERHSVGETDLRRELDNAVDEQRRSETRCRRWVAQLEEERDALATRVAHLAERNAELEGREAALEYRIRKMEAVEQGLRNELANMEQSLEDSTTGEIFEERLLAGGGPRTDFSTDDEVQSSDHIRDCRLAGTVAVLRQKLERVDKSKLALEERLREQQLCEDRLRETIEEYENSDIVWQEKVVALETQKKALMQTIDDLEAQLSDVQQRYHDYQDAGFSSRSNEYQRDELQLQEMIDANRKRLSQGLWPTSLEDSLATAMKNIMMLSTVADDADDVELAYWAAVEWAAANDSDDVNTESAVTSPHWAKVEQSMGLTTDEADVTHTHQALLELHPDEITQKPPLPTSLPPEVNFPTTGDETDTGSSITVDADAQLRAVSTALLGNVDQKPEVHAVIPERKLIILHAADSRRPRSADIFQSKAVLATSSTAEPIPRAQSETRDVTDSWNKPPKKEQSSAMENLASSANDASRDHAKQAVRPTEEDAKERISAADADSLKEIRQRASHAQQFWTARNGEPKVTQSGSSNADQSATRPSLIPRPTSTQTTGAGSNGGGTPEMQSASAASSTDKKKSLPVYSTALTSPRSHIPRPITDASKTNADENDAADSPKTMPVQTVDKSEEQTKTTKSSYFLGSLSSTGARVDARPEMTQVRLRSVSSTPSNRWGLNGPGGRRE